MTITTATSPVNKVAAHWAQKVINRRLQKMGILDTGATSGAAPEEDEDAFEDRYRQTIKENVHVPR
jgi:hypothetical protein